MCVGTGEQQCDDCSWWSECDCDIACAEQRANHIGEILRRLHQDCWYYLLLGCPWRLFACEGFVCLVFCRLLSIFFLVLLLTLDMRAGVFGFSPSGSITSLASPLTVASYVVSPSLSVSPVPLTLCHFRSLAQISLPLTP